MVSAILILCGGALPPHGWPDLLPWDHVLPRLLDRLHAPCTRGVPVYVKRGDRIEQAPVAPLDEGATGWIALASSGQVPEELAPLGWPAEVVALLGAGAGHARADRRGDVWLLSVYLPRDSGDPQLVRVALSPSLLITVAPADEPLLAAAAADLPDRPYLLGSPSALLAELCQRAADGFLEQVDAYDDAFDQLEDSVLTGQDRARHVFSLRRQLHSLRLTIAEMRRTAGQLARRSGGAGAGGDTDVFVDVYESLYHIIDNIDALRDNLTGLVDLQLNQRSMRLNEVMKFLTIFSTIFLPITFITGFFGMNLRPMPELFIPFSQDLTILLMLLVVAVMIYIFHRRGWL